MMIKKILVLICLLWLSNSTFAGGTWYYGTVDRVALLGANESGGGFVVTLSSNALNDCTYEYAYFYVGELGDEVVKKAYNLAITSLLTGREFGVVIDKALPGVCRARGMTADLT